MQDKAASGLKGAFDCHSLEDDGCLSKAHAQSWVSSAWSVMP